MIPLIYNSSKNRLANFPANLVISIKDNLHSNYVASERGIITAPEYFGRIKFGMAGLKILLHFGDILGIRR